MAGNLRDAVRKIGERAGRRHGAACCAARQQEDPTALRAKVWLLLEDVADPEIPVLSVVDLGIVRQVEAGDAGIEVVITPTYSGCPATHVIEADIRRKLDESGFADARISTRLAPAWTTDWLSEAGREKLRAYGIAPPPRGATGGKRALLGLDEPALACPRCGSEDTEKISEFGSTPCKAHWRCRACLEPFDAFKCI